MAAFFLVALCPPASADGSVVLIGVDGGEWSVLDELLAEGAMPHFARLMERGIHGDLEALDPLISPVVWTSIATGVGPDEHGVFDFYHTAADIRRKTLWETVSDQGLRVGVYDYLMTWPPRPLGAEGFVVPGWLRRDDDTWPDDLFRSSGLEEPYRYSVHGYWTEDAAIEAVREELARKPATFVHLLEQHRPHLAATTFYAMDVVSHRFWAAAYPEQFSPHAELADPRHRDVIRETAIGLDRAVGRILDALDPADTVLLVSDHGFRAYDRGALPFWRVRLTDLIERAGLDPVRDGITVVTEWGVPHLRIERGPYEARRAVRERLAETFGSMTDPSGRSLFWLLALDGDEARERGDVGLLARLGQRLVRWYLSAIREVEIDEEVHAAFLLVPRDRILARAVEAGELEFDGRTVDAADLVVRHRFSGEHRPEGIFLAAGPPIRHDPERLQLSVLEVAPLVAYLAGARLASSFAEPVPERVIQPAYWAAHPPLRMDVASASPEPRPRAPSTDPRLKEKLRSLGYLDAADHVPSTPD